MYSSLSPIWYPWENMLERLPASFRTGGQPGVFQRKKIRGGNLLRLFTDGKPVHGGGSIPNVATRAVDPYTLSDPTTIRQVAQRNNAHRAYARDKLRERDIVAISEAELIQFIAHKHRIKIEQPRSKEEMLEERELRDNRLSIVTRFRKFDCITDQIDQHLPQPPDISTQLNSHIFGNDGSNIQPFGMGCSGQQIDGFFHTTAQVEI